MGAQWLPGERGYPDACLPARYWVYTLGTRALQKKTPRKTAPTQMRRLPRISLFFNITRFHSDSPGAASICWVRIKHAVTTQIRASPEFPYSLTLRVFIQNFIQNTDAAPPQFFAPHLPSLLRKESSGDRPIIAHDFENINSFEY